MRHCIRCGAPLDHNGRFCGQCGYRVKRVVAPVGSSDRNLRVRPAEQRLFRGRVFAGLLVGLAVCSVAIGLLLGLRNGGGGTPGRVALGTTSTTAVVEETKTTTGGDLSTGQTPGTEISTRPTIQTFETSGLGTLAGANVMRNGDYGDPGRSFKGKLVLKAQGGGSTTPIRVDGLIAYTKADGALAVFDPLSAEDVQELQGASKVTTISALAKGKSQPCSGGGLLFVGRGPAFFAFDPSDGTELWRFEVGKYGNFECSPLIVDDVVYFGGGEGYLYALRASTGDLIWRFACRGAVETDPAYWRGLLFFRDRDTLYAVDAERGSVVWEAPAPYSPQIAVSEDGLLFSSGDNGRWGSITAYDALTGETLWQNDYEDKTITRISPPAASKGLVYTTI